MSLYPDESIDAREAFPLRENGPPSGAFLPARWRGTTSNPRLSDKIGLSFDLVDGTVCRLLLSEKSARQVAAGLLERIAYREEVLTNSQSDNSSGNSSVDVSGQRE